MIRVVLPPQLQTLARVGSVVVLAVDGPVTQQTVFDALEARHPALRGTLRDPVTQQLRPRIRLFACEENLSQVGADTPLPEAVVSGAEPLLIVGAISGG